MNAQAQIEKLSYLFGFWFWGLFSPLPIYLSPPMSWTLSLSISLSVSISVSISLSLLRTWSESIIGCLLFTKAWDLERIKRASNLFHSIICTFDVGYNSHSLTIADACQSSVTRCWIKKVAKMFPKVAHIISTADFTSFDLLKNSPKVNNLCGLGTL